MLVCAEEKTFLSRGWSKFLELILTGKEMSTPPPRPDNPCCPVYHMPFTQPTFLLDVAHLSLSSPTLPPQNCYPNAMIGIEYLLTLQKDKLHMTDINYMTSCSLERHWDMKRYKILPRTEWNRKCLYFSVVL